MQSAASPSLPHSPTSTNHTESSPGGMQTGDHCGHPRAVLPQKWSPPSAPAADSLQRRTQPAGAVRLQRPQPADAGTLDSGWLYHAVAHQPRGGWLPIPSARACETARTKRGAIPPFRRSEGSARYPPRAAGVVTLAGESTVCRLGSVRVGERRRGRSGRLVLSSGRMRAGWRLVGHSLNTLLYVSRECVACSAMLSPS